MAEGHRLGPQCASLHAHCAATNDRLITIPGPIGSSCDPPDRCAHARGHRMARLMRIEHCAPGSRDWDHWDHYSSPATATPALQRPAYASCDPLV
eukprot:CAMPEP_0174694002 /NCGR_PEP_ID=MMETSP1094-20130205/641_1 /TAXON_ID=156173 /ORGANISM="Chrysochromulina brevifilum, Strain UTEX LB 985" /LENGTH=94 /DNA_ID=CAMNT_0015890093 /DNA_START=41 /DNA_END=325 /DNA_ORIENTATION=-